MMTATKTVRKDTVCPQVNLNESNTYFSGWGRGAGLQLEFKHEDGGSCKRLGSWGKFFTGDGAGMTPASSPPLGTRRVSHRAARQF
jgi:hypothetical protein